MPNENDLDYISNVLSEAATKLRKVKKKVTHGKVSLERKKIKNQVMKKSKPKDFERDKICRNARKKAHGTVADTRRNISNHVRQGLHEEVEPLVVVNDNTKSIQEAFNFDFMEEANGAGVSFEFFDKPVVTPISESIDVGLTPTGRKKKCKAIGIAEGCFQPITTPDGERVFSRNKRLYDVDHWQYQLENRGIAERVAMRDMVGTIGHHDKRVDDDDFANERVSHVVTDLEIREDEVNGIYLWGRLEILNTKAGRALKTYYESDLNLYVSSRGGGKLLDVIGKDYKRVDKTKYFCETFDVVRAPGFLEAMPIYYNILSEDEENADIDASNIDESKLSIATQREDYSITEEDNNMPKVNCTITADTNIDDMAGKLLNSMSEKLAELTDTVAKISADIYESEEEVVADEVSAVDEAPEAVVEEAAEEVEAPAEEIVEEAEEPKAEEASVEEAPAAEEAPVEKIEENVDEEKPAEEAQAEEVPADEQASEEIKEETEVEAEAVEEVSETEVAEEPKAEEAPVEEVTMKQISIEEITEEKECDGKDGKCDKEDGEKCDKCKDEEKKEKVDEEWAHIDPKETAPATNDPHLAKQGKADTPFTGDCYAHEDPGTDTVVDATKAPKEVVADEKKLAVKDAVITEEAGEEAQAEEPVEQVEVVDYKAMYEAMQNEVNEALQVIDEMIETFKDFGKRHKEIVEGKESEISDVKKQLNSYKLSEKFNIAVEEASKMLGSKDYEQVVEELKAEEATKVEEEAQVTVEKVSESIEEAAQPKAPAPREVYSVFSAPKQEVISEEVVEETKNSRVFSWF